MFLRLISIVAGCSVCTTALSADTKLAVLCTDDTGRVALADLLTAELSATPGLIMLDRAELTRVLREQSLSQLSSAALVKAGQLLGADGLLVLDPSASKGATTLNLRVIGVRHGVALAWWKYRIDAEQRLAWAKASARQVQQLAPKITSSPTNAPRISFIGFTSPSSTHAAALLERELNSLLLQRLQAQPDLLVLERQTLLDAAVEKSISSDDQRFWNGAYLLDGTINRDNISPDKLTLHFRLVSPEKSAPEPVLVSGSPTNLVQLSADFLQLVRKILNASGPGVAWDPAIEAKRFYAEAESAVRACFWAEARTAADTALALGLDDMDLRRVRLLAYAGGLAPVLDELALPYVPRWGVLRSYPAPPPAGALDNGLALAYQLQDLLRPPTKIYDDRQLRGDFKSALVAVGDLTFTHYICAELRLGKEEKLATLRAAMREVTDALLAGTPSAELDQSVRKYGPLWQETPEESLKLHDRLRPMPPGWDRDHYYIESETDWTPRVSGWKTEDRLRVTEVWKNRPALAPVAAPILTAEDRVRQLLEQVGQTLAQGKVPDIASLMRIPLNTPAERAAALDIFTKVKALPESDYKQLVRPLVESRLAVLRGEAGKPVVTNRPSGALSVTNGLRAGMVQNRPAFPNRPTGFGGPPVVTNAPLPLPIEGPPLVAKRLNTDLNGEIRRLFWSEPKFWGLCSFTTMEDFGTQFETGIFEMDPETGAATRVRVPANLFFADKVTDIAVLPERVLLFVEERVIVFDRNTKVFTSMVSPLRSSRVFQNAGAFYLYNNESILRTSPDLSRTEVLASVRRRPPVNDLDSLPAFEAPELFSTGESNVILRTRNGVYLLEGNRWLPLVKPEPSGILDSASGVALCTHSSEFLVRQVFPVGPLTNVHRLHYFGPEVPKGQLWCAGYQSMMLRRIPGEPPFLPLLPEPDQEPNYASIQSALPIFKLQGQIVLPGSTACVPIHGELFTIALPWNSTDKILLTHWPSDGSPRTIFPISLAGLKPQGGVFANEQLIVVGARLFFWNPRNVPEANRIWTIDCAELLALKKSNNP